jgi:hypothetical protein
MLSEQHFRQCDKKQGGNRSLRPAAGIDAFPAFTLFCRLLIAGSGQKPEFALSYRGTAHLQILGGGMHLDWQKQKIA